METIDLISGILITLTVPLIKDLYDLWYEKMGLDDKNDEIDV